MTWMDEGNLQPSLSCATIPHELSGVSCLMLPTYFDGAPESVGPPLRGCCNFKGVLKTACAVWEHLGCCGTMRGECRPRRRLGRGGGRGRGGERADRARPPCAAAKGGKGFTVASCLSLKLQEDIVRSVRR